MADAVFDINKMRVNDIISDIDGYIGQVEEVLELYGDRRLNEIKDAINIYEATGQMKGFNTEPRDILNARLGILKAQINADKKTFDSISDDQETRTFAIYETKENLYLNIAKDELGNRQLLKERIDTYIGWYCSLNIDIKNINRQLRNCLGIIKDQYALSAFYVKHTTTLEHNIGQLYFYQYNKNRRLKNLLRKISRTYINYQEFITDIGAMYDKDI